MAKYKVDWLENDKYGNIKVSVTREDNTKILEAILGKEFQSKGVMPGHEIEAKEWRSPKNNKLYLFESKEEEHTAYRAVPVVKKDNSIKQAQERKAESIEKTLDRKEESIKLASAQRDAVLIVTTLMNIPTSTPVGSGDWIRSEITKWRNWFLNDKDFNNPPPFNDEI